MGTLTTKTVEKLAKAAVAGMTNDGDGLYFKVGQTGGSSWIFRYKIAGKGRDMGIGKYPEITLADAREKTADARKLTKAGHDPLAVRDAEREQKRLTAEAERANESRRVTFETLADDYLAAHGSHWSAAWRKGWRRKLELYAFPHIGKLPADKIETEHVLSVLQPIWAIKTRTADEVRGQIEQVLDAAKSRNLREGENPARWRGHLDNLLSKADKKKARKRQHFAAMKWQDLGELMTKLRKDESRVAVALQLLLLTGARSHMVRFAVWDEFDLQARAWSLPADRMKTGKPFVVPLADEVIELLENLAPVGESPYLFPGIGRSGIIHGDAMRDRLVSHGYAGLTVHGFRSTFRDWAGERTHYPREVCEMALAHDERDQTEGAYSRTDFLEKRRALMANWASYAVSTPSDKVVKGAFGTQARQAGD